MIFSAGAIRKINLCFAPVPKSLVREGVYGPGSFYEFEGVSEQSSLAHCSRTKGPETGASSDL